MFVKASLFLLLNVSLLLLQTRGEETQLTNCDEEDTLEARTSFKNCVDSARVSILESAKDAQELNPLCEKLNNLFSTCEDERITLIECTSETNVNNVMEAHILALDKVIESVVGGLDVKSCSIFKNMGKSDEEYFAEYEGDHTHHHQEEEDYEEGKGESEFHPSKGVSAFASLSLLLTLSTFAVLWT